MRLNYQVVSRVCPVTEVNFVIRGCSDNEYSQLPFHYQTVVHQTNVCNAVYDSNSIVYGSSSNHINIICSILGRPNSKYVVSGRPRAGKLGMGRARVGSMARPNSPEGVFQRK